MATNADLFNQEVKAVVRDMTGPQLVLFHKKIALEGLRRIVLKTPVDTGRARGNWQVGINTVNSDQLPVSKDKSGSASITKGVNTVVSGTKPFCNIRIFNNLPYITKLEYGQFIPPNPGPTRDPRPERFGLVWVENGYSIQAPNGMVDVTIGELRSMFRKSGLAKSTMSSEAQIDAYRGGDK